MRATEYRNRAPRLELVTEGIGNLGRFGECPYEDKINVVGQFIDKILEASVTEKCDIMSLLLAP
jgi:hypothetical protein